MGRLDTYTAAVAQAICEQLATGQNMVSICSADDMPCDRTVRTWVEKYPEFAAAIADARVRGFDAIAAECKAIADTPVDGIETTTRADGSVEVKRCDMLGHRKLQIETRLKLLAKWDPKRYGERLDLNHSGSIGISERMARAEERRIKR